MNRESRHLISTISTPVQSACSPETSATYAPDRAVDHQQALSRHTAARRSGWYRPVSAVAVHGSVLILFLRK
jgi:hypothetical protein